MILQTDIYDKSVKNKMTLQLFFKSSKLSMERDLGEDYLKYCFDEILTEPLEIHSGFEQQQNCKISWTNQGRKSLQQQIYIIMPRLDYIKLFMEVFSTTLFFNLNVIIERTVNIQIIQIDMQNATYTLQLMSKMSMYELCQQFIQQLCQSAVSENEQLKQKKTIKQCDTSQIWQQQSECFKKLFEPVLEVISSINYLLNEKQK